MCTNLIFTLTHISSYSYDKETAGLKHPCQKILVWRLTKDKLLHFTKDCLPNLKCYPDVILAFDYWNQLVEDIAALSITKFDVGSPQHKITVP